MALRQTTQEVRALVRPASIGKPIIQSFQNRGVKIVPADISSTSEAELTELLEGVDTVITAFDAFNLKQQIPLIHASSVAGVKRFIPTFFGTPAPRGIMSFRDQVRENSWPTEDKTSAIANTWTETYRRKRS